MRFDITKKINEEILPEKLFGKLLKLTPILKRMTKKTTKATTDAAEKKAVI